MSVTATRIGSTPLTLDWSNLKTFNLKTEPYQAAWTLLKGRFDSGEVGFYNTPIDPALSQADESIALAERLLATGKFTDCIFIGIGGSSLGPICALQALEHQRKTDLRFHFLENPDPIDWTLQTRGLSPESTLVVAVTKSGTTFETLAIFMLALEWLTPARWSSQVVILTDPKKGELKIFAEKEKIPTLSIAPSLGGRFSIFSPVGLFPMRLAGLDCKEFLQGARQVRDYIEKTPLEKNPLMLISDQLIQSFPKKNVHVCMPYSTRLRAVGQWWVQLWGESLGKDRKGFSPIASVGANDQHSLVQLLRDGPDDKVIWFISVDEVSKPVTIPSHPSFRFPGSETLSLLQGHTLQELLLTEFRATSKVLTKQSRANFHFQLDRLDERSLGALLFTLCSWTAICGTLWGVNPFDQPGVEEAKVYIREALSNTQEERHRKEDADAQSPVHRLRST